MSAYICTVIKKKQIVMKTMLKNILTAAVLLGTAMGFAKGPAIPEVEKKIISLDKDPVFVTRGQTVLMNLLNLSQDKVSLKVFDSLGRLVFQETVDGKLVVEKAFNFEKAFEDRYTIVVSDAKGTYKEVVEVK